MSVNARAIAQRINSRLTVSLLALSALVITLHGVSLAFLVAHATHVERDQLAAQPARLLAPGIIVAHAHAPTALTHVVHEARRANPSILYVRVSDATGLVVQEGPPPPTTADAGTAHGDATLRELVVEGHPVTETTLALHSVEGWAGTLQVGVASEPQAAVTARIVGGALAFLVLLLLASWPVARWLAERLAFPMQRLASDYAGLLEHTSLYVVIEDEQHRVRHASATFSRYFGADCLGRPTHEVLGVPASTLLEGEVALTVQGVPRTLHLVRFPVELDDEHRPRRFGLVGTDVTEFRRAELERLRLAAALEGLDDVVLLVEDGQGIVYANPALLAQTGLVPGFVHGKDPVDVLAGDDEARTLLADRDRDSWRGRFLGRRVDGAPWQCALAIARVEGAGFEVWVARDVSREADLEGQLRQSQKLEAIGQLAGGVAHDFNNLLTVVLSNTQALLLEDTLAEEQKESVQMIDEAGQRAAQLTRQLLAFGRRQVLHVQEVDLAEVVTRATSLLRRVIGAGIALETDTPRPLWSIRADAGQVEQVLMNLAINARDAMPGGGTLEVALVNATLDATPTADGGTAPAGDYVVLRVSDTGTGMSPETMGRIFEPFFTTKPAGRGTGLGLSTVLGIVRQSGAFIWVDSEPGRGTAFRIAFPRRGAEVVDEAKKPPDVERGHGERVLLVEDEPLVRRVMERMLGEAGYQVSSAGHGVEALELLDGGLAPDVVLSDVVMPRMGGLELREKLRARKLPVVLMSGYSAEVVELGGIDDSELLWKPASRPAVLAALRRALLRG